MDEADRAAALIEATTANALARIHAAQAQAGQADCEDCGGPPSAASNANNTTKGDTVGNPNIPLWKFIFDIIQTTFTVGITIYVWILSKHKANASRIAALEDKATEELGQVKNRLTELETRLEHLPNREAIGNIHKRLDRQAETLHKMEGALDGVNDTSKLILEVLLKGDKS